VRLAHRRWRSMGTNGWVVKSYPASDQFTTQYYETIKAVSEVSGIDVFPLLAQRPLAVLFRGTGHD